MKQSVTRYLILFRRSRVMLGVGLVLAWGAFFGALYAGGGGTLFLQPASRRSQGPVSPLPPASNPVQILEQEWRFFNIPDLPMSSLKKVLNRYGLHLICTPSQASLKMKAGEYTGKYLAEILLDLFRPYDLGFYHQGPSLYVTEMTVKKDRKDPVEKGGEARQSNIVRTTVRAKVGEPIDLWVDNDPLIRLRVQVQPLYGEADKTDLINFSVDAYRNQMLWFSHNLKARLGEEAQISAKAGGQIMWCLITPTVLSGQDISYKMEFNYETLLSSI
jgi:hypothetical protein